MAQVGQGGTGSDPGIPECRVCGSYGGGGHGGFCPNMGKPPEQWVTEPPPGFLRAPRHRSAPGR
jgi:hypothetical protein